MSPMLHVIYRSCGSDNGKRRPSFSSKDLALQSSVRALRPVAASTEVLL